MSIFSSLVTVPITLQEKIKIACVFHKKSLSSIELNYAEIIKIGYSLINYSRGPFPIIHYQGTNLTKLIFFTWDTNSGKLNYQQEALEFKELESAKFSWVIDTSQKWSCQSLSYFLPLALWKLFSNLHFHPHSTYDVYYCTAIKYIYLSPEHVTWDGLTIITGMSESQFFTWVEMIIMKRITKITWHFATYIRPFCILTKSPNTH